MIALFYLLCAAAVNAHQTISRISLEQAYDNIKYRYDARRVSATANMSYNVLDYGAVGDAMTDNTQAFTAAFKAAQDQGGAIVFAPTGRYVINGQLSIPPGVSLLGMLISYKCVAVCSYLTVPYIA